jgi:L-threonylcarbamoyladenylate synthase
MKTHIAPVREDDPDPAIISSAAMALKNDGLVIFPTETVYGLGCNAYSGTAALKIFEVKGRPADNPLIVHFSDIEMLGQIASHIPAIILERWNLFWPGPLTIILPKSDRIPMEVSGGLNSVAVRMPAGRIAMELINAAGIPVAAPSANISTRPSITDSRFAIQDFEGTVDVILDAGPPRLGIESSVIDVRSGKPVLLRAGSMTAEAISLIFGEIEIDNVARGLEMARNPISPGTKYKHYSPERPIFVTSDLGVYIEINRRYSNDPRVFFMGVNEAILPGTLKQFTLGSIDEPAVTGSRLFRGFRELDISGSNLGIIHPFQEKLEGLAIMNRVRKASTGVVSSVEEFKRILESD